MKALGRLMRLYESSDDPDIGLWFILLYLHERATSVPLEDLSIKHDKPQ